MGKSSGSSVEVTDYKMSLHYGIAHGPVDSLKEIFIGEKTAWHGSQEDEGAISIVKRGLFGGNKKEGGAVGTAYYLPGGDDQVMPALLAGKLGKTPSTCPAFRGIASVFFYTNGLGSGLWNDYAPGFLWGCNNPYLRSIWFRLSRSPKVLSESSRSIESGATTIKFDHNTVTVNGYSAHVDDGATVIVNNVSVSINNKTVTVNGNTIEAYPNNEDTCLINGAEYEFRNNVANDGTISVVLLGLYVESGNYHGIISVKLSPHTDANPAAIIYECLTNTTWGMGSSTTSLDTDSFETAAQTLLSEGFGMSMVWTKQSTIEAFVSEVLDHIQGMLYLNPQTGKLTLKLIRADYDTNDLLTLDKTNCTVTSFDRKGWGETTNEIVVTWTNPENEQEETVTVQDLANISIQGAVISDSRNYYGVRSLDLALQLAKRDLATASAPLATFEIEVNRKGWSLTPGSCVVLTYPEYGIEELVLRITKIEYGRRRSSAIKLSLIEDIFSVPTGSYTALPGSQWEDTSQEPEALSLSRVITAPAYFVMAGLSAVELKNLDYPDVYPAILSGASNNDTFELDLFENTTQANGDSEPEMVGTMPVLGHMTLSEALVQESFSDIPQVTGTNGNTWPSKSSFLIIGNVNEVQQEIALIYAVGTDTWTLARGILDTTPKAWPAGTPVWFVNKTTNWVDFSEVRGATETTAYRLRPRTSLGQLAYEDTPVTTSTLSDRPHLPYRPAGVRINGQLYGTLDLTGTTDTTATVSWGVRNRLMEEKAIVPWNLSTVTPETGQTTTVRVRNLSGTILATYDDLTGTSFDLPLSAFGSEAQCDVEVLSKRDGLTSFQYHTIRVRVAAG